MRIAQVSLQYGPSITGGGGVHVEKIVEYLQAAGHQVTVLSIHTAPTLASGPELSDGVWSLDAGPPEVVRFLTDEGIEDPYVGDKRTELDRILRFSELAAAWLRERADDFDVVHLHGHHAVPGWIAAQLRDLPLQVVSTLHYLESTNVTATKGGLMHYQIEDDDLARMKEWEAMARFADSPVIISPGQRVDFVALLNELGHDPKPAEAKLRLVSSGIDPGSVRARDEVEKKLASPPDTVRMLTFARLDPVKGFEYAARGAALAADKIDRPCALTLAGVPEEEVYIPVLKHEVEAASAKLSVELKVLDGIYKPAVRDAFFDNFDVYLFPTLREPFGITVIEAAARGLAVVTTDSPGPLYFMGTEGAAEHPWGWATDHGLLLRRTDDPEKNLTGHVAAGLEVALGDWSQTAARALSFHKLAGERFAWPGVVDAYLKLYRGQ